MNFFQWIRKKLEKSWFNYGKEQINPDEIFIDSKNLPHFDLSQFEGRFEKTISRKVIFFISVLFLCVGALYTYTLWDLQIQQGEKFAQRSENNRLHETVVFADRGVIFDRNKILLAWNAENSNDSDFSVRRYATTTGLSNLIGYVKYPSKDKAGFYYREDYLGVDGVEKFFGEKIQGRNGIKITETDVSGHVESQVVLNPPRFGENITLSIDSRVQSKLYEIISLVAEDRGFTGGAGVIMDVNNGEIIAEVTYPEYSSQILTDGSDKQKIQEYFKNKKNPLLDRATSGLYAPGSIVKPVMALAALNEGVITADKVLYTTGSISIPNKYNPENPTIFRDWKDQGAVDMRKAIEQSSDVYFYEIGGGYGDQKGMGIANIEKYARLFGYGMDVGSPFFGTKKGIVPNPQWKAENFDGDAWRVGNTYHTVIGQYGFQVTPLQVVRATAAIANYGTLLGPTIIAGDKSLLPKAERIDLPKNYFNVVHDGMRQSAEFGTAAALNVDYEEFAAKTGTAEIGANKSFVNSWITGFFPYKNPRYAFVVLMERGPVHNLTGAPYVARQFFDWMNESAPEYFSKDVQTD